MKITSNKQTFIMKHISIICYFFMALFAFNLSAQDKSLPFDWDNATVYFVMTDRFENGDSSNDNSYGRQPNAAPLRSYLGGDLQGLINKLDQGYFDELGVSAIWITPPYENIHGTIGQGAGKNYAFHGYWAKDWTTIDNNLGSEATFRDFVDTAHEHGIRVIMDVVLNHVGPDTPQDQSWPNDWVRRDPDCNFNGPQGTIPCELVNNLPDIRTERNDNVSIPGWLQQKWQSEGRATQENAELDVFFNRTGYPRSPRHYIIKWLTDYVRDYGVDGFRVDTVKHVEDFVWNELNDQGIIALQEWKNNNPSKKLDDLPFWMTGEVFNYNALSMKRRYNGDGFNVDYYNSGFENLINFDFRFKAEEGLESIFSAYSNLLRFDLGGDGVMNFLANHDTEEVFDRERQRTFEAGTKLLLSPATAQIYYGDETARTLTPGGGVQGDATLRSFMNFSDLNNANSLASLTLEHHRKLGRFRREHLSVGAGVHSLVNQSPYVFKREYNKNGLVDKTLVYTGNDGDFQNSLALYNLWPDGTMLKDYFSGNTAVVSNNRINFNTPFGLVLIGIPAEVIETIDPIDPVEASSITIRAKKPADWNNINAYVFNAATNNVLAGTQAWPGITMSPVPSSSLWFTYTINVPAGVNASDVRIVFNTNGQNSQSVDLSRDRDGWFTFTSSGAVRTGTWSNECPSDCPDTVSSSYRVYVNKPQDWQNIKGYVFNAGQNTMLNGEAGWPGNTLTKLTGTNNWFYYDINPPSGVSPKDIGIVWNNNNQGSQSVDLKRNREGWFSFTSSGRTRTGTWSDTCPFDCNSNRATAALSSIETLENTTFKVDVYPNPSNGSFQFQLQSKVKNSVATTLKIYDLYGKLIKEEVFTLGKSAQVPVYLQDSGMYIYHLTMDKEIISGKLMVQK